MAVTSLFTKDKELMEQGDRGTADDGRKEPDRDADVDAYLAPEVNTDIAAAEEDEDAAPSTSRTVPSHGGHRAAPDVEEHRHQQKHGLTGVGNDRWLWPFRHLLLRRLSNAGAAVHDCLSRFITSSRAVDEDTPADQHEQQLKRCSKYSEKTLMFAITISAACFAYSSVNVVFKVSMAAFSMAAFFMASLVDLISAMKPKWGVALIYLSWFLLVLVLYLRLVSFNKYYGYAILPVPLPIVAAFLHHKLRPGVQRSTDHSETDLDGIFDLSAGVVNSGGLISMIFSMVGPNQSIAVSAAGCLFFFTIVLGLYLMMIATVRNVALTSHAIYLAMLLKFLVVSTLIATLIH